MITAGGCPEGFSGARSNLADRPVPCSRARLPIRSFQRAVLFSWEIWGRTRGPILRNPNGQAKMLTEFNSGLVVSLWINPRSFEVALQLLPGFVPAR